MRICIYGAGAIGGYMGARLSLSGVDVTLVARGPHLEAMDKNGLKIIAAGEEKTAYPKCTDNPAEVGPQDYVIITLKAPSVAGILNAMQPLLGEETCVVTTANGIPWWYFYGLKGPWENHRLKTVDPDNRQWNQIGPQRVIGCVVYPACEISEPGVIRHIEGNRFTLGEPGGEKSDRCMQLSKAFISAGFKSPVRSEIRNEIWVKLWGNLCFNPISVLTHATLDVIATQADTRAIAKSMMLEAQAVGEKLGVRFGIDIEKRINGAAAVGAHKTSMLQDLEAGRTMEIDALLGVIKELGQLVGVATPVSDTVLALVQQRARVAGCY